MKIKDLEQHCGDCDLMEFCGRGYDCCLCYDERFANMDETDYRKIAETATNIKPLEACQGCTRPNCEAYRYSDDDYENEDCEHSDEFRDYYYKQIADFVESVIKEKE